MAKGKRSIKGKIYGARCLLERFKKDLEDNFFSVSSPVKDSDQGDCHLLFTVFYLEEVTQ
ncbi:hypothetical protein ES703_32579 [subsurface metagenome]